MFLRRKSLGKELAQGPQRHHKPVVANINQASKRQRLTTLAGYVAGDLWPRLRLHQDLPALKDKNGAWMKRRCKGPRVREISAWSGLCDSASERSVEEDTAAECSEPHHPQQHGGNRGEAVGALAPGCCHEPLLQVVDRVQLA